MVEHATQTVTQRQASSETTAEEAGEAGPSSGHDAQQPRYATEQQALQQDIDSEGSSSEEEQQMGEGRDEAPVAGTPQGAREREARESTRAKRRAQESAGEAGSAAVHQQKAARTGSVGNSSEADGATRGGTITSGHKRAREESAEAERTPARGKEAAHEGSSSMHIAARPRDAVAAEVRAGTRRAVIRRKKEGRVDVKRQIAAGPMTICRIVDDRYTVADGAYGEGRRKRARSNDSDQREARRRARDPG